MLSSVAVRAGELLAAVLTAGIVVLAAGVTGVWDLDTLGRRLRRAAHDAIPASALDLGSTIAAHATYQSLNRASRPGFTLRT